MNNAELVRRAKDIKFAVLRLGLKISDTGAVPVAHEVTLLRELLSRREADLYARIHDVLVSEVALADVLGVERDPEGHWVQKIVKMVLERMLRPDEDHSTSDPRAVLVELIEEAKTRELASSR